MKPTPWHRLLVVAASLVLLLGACGGTDEPTDTAVDTATEDTATDTSTDEGTGGGSGETLSAVDNSFSPRELAVSSGEVTVTFTNDGSNPHTFTSEELGFDSGTVQPGDSADVTFTAPSKPTSFQCSIHGSGGMTGEIVLAE